MSYQSPIVFDTLGKLHALGHGLFGYCRNCRRISRHRLHACRNEVSAGASGSSLLRFPRMAEVMMRSWACSADGLTAYQLKAGRRARTSKVRNNSDRQRSLL